MAPKKAKADSGKEVKKKEKSDGEKPKLSWGERLFLLLVVAILLGATFILPQYLEEHMAGFEQEMITQERMAAAQHAADRGDVYERYDPRDDAAAQAKGEL